MPPITSRRPGARATATGRLGSKMLDAAAISVGGEEVVGFERVEEGGDVGRVSHVGTERLPSRRPRRQTKDLGAVVSGTS